ncbi:MAG: hypothetical protein K2G75_06120 [Muribaculaceae bacterium]|nr:hypothetical protein [Muribaculaceae bacterium]
MDVLSLVKRKANLPTLMMGAASVFAGTGVAAIRGKMELLSASVCLLAVIFGQLAANLGHYYLELSRHYDNVPLPPLHEKKWVGDSLGVRVLREGSVACIIITAMLSFAVIEMAKDAWWVFIVGAVIIISNLLMSYTRRPLFGTPWVLFFTWLIFGPITVIGTALVQIQYESPVAWRLFDIAPALYMGPALGLLAVNVHLVYSYSMSEIDPRSNLYSTAARLGRKGVEWLMFVNGLIMLVVTFFMAFHLDLPHSELAIVPAFLAFAFNTYISLRIHRAMIGELVHLNMLVKINMLLTGLLTLILWIQIGAPDNSVRIIF